MSEAWGVTAAEVHIERDCLENFCRLLISASLISNDKLAFSTFRPKVQRTVADRRIRLEKLATSRLPVSFTTLQCSGSLTQPVNYPHFWGLLYSQTAD